MKRPTLALRIATLLTLGACQDHQAIQESTDEDTAIDADVAEADVPDADDDAQAGDTAPDPDAQAGDTAPTPDVDVDASTDATADADDDADDGDDADATINTEPCADGRLVLDADSLVFEELPTGAIRYGLSGEAGGPRACVVVVLEGQRPLHGYCSDGPNPLGDPASMRASIFTDHDGPCADLFWSNARDGELVIEGAEGCYAAAGAPWSPYWGPLLADFSLTTTWTDAAGASRACEIVFDNTASFEQAPVLFGFEHRSDIPEDVFLQLDDGQGGPAWLRVLQEGEVAGSLLHASALPTCDGEPAPAWSGTPSVLQATFGDHAGGVYWGWDGTFFVPDAAAGCVARQPAAPGDYALEVCYGYLAEDANPGQRVANPTCRAVPFTYPSAAPVIVRVDNGG